MLRSINFLIVALTCCACRTIPICQSHEWKVRIASKYYEQGFTDANTKEFVVPSDTEFKFDLKGSPLNCVLKSDKENLGFRIVDCEVFSAVAGCEWKATPSMIQLNVPVGKDYAYFIRINCE